MYGADTIKDLLYNYSGQTWLFGVFLICAISLYTTLDGIKKKYMAVYSMGGLLLITPLFQQLAQKMGAEGERYRFLWLFPVAFVIAGYTIYVVIRQKKKSHKIILGAVLMLIIYLSGDAYLTSDSLKLPENIYGISNDTIRVSEIIDATKTEGYVVTALAPEQQLMLRQLNASVIWAIRREAYIRGYIPIEEWDDLDIWDVEEQMLLGLVSQGSVYDEAAMKNCIESRGVDYFVISKEYDLEEYMSTVGCENVGESAHYIVYKVIEG